MLCLRRGRLPGMLLSLVLGMGAVHAASPSITMLVVPARYSVMQVAFDMIDLFPSVLVSYQGSARTPQPAIHAWNGREWVRVSVADYQRANFLQILPSRAILVGDDAVLPPSLLEISLWCPRIERVRAQDTAALLNALGPLYSFTASDWRWFAARYNLDLSVTNEDERRASWYSQPNPFLKAKREGLPDPSAPERMEDIPPAAIGEEILIEEIEIEEIEFELDVSGRGTLPVEAEAVEEEVWIEERLPVPAPPRAPQPEEPSIEDASKDPFVK